VCIKNKFYHKNFYKNIIVLEKSFGGKTEKQCQFKHDLN